MKHYSFNKIEYRKYKIKSHHKWDTLENTTNELYI